MAVFKCKMCGGELSVVAGHTVATCDYCGSSQTISTTSNEEIQRLFNKANDLRRRCEFDKAEKLYERIISENESDAESYFGALLCKYGIEYVDDPKTGKKIPTCHRASYESIKSDEYYLNAIKYADVLQKSHYENEVNEIARLQKEILLISEKEDPYDVFICYKESDEFGKRTPDSVIANDIYYELTNKGYKVFFAAITLENKLGEAYEPIIFAALNSAKVMLVIGTKPEYFNAVWVKNEWSRFLKLIKKDRSRKIIPCYKDMDAYDLPEEFAHLQAQNMEKIGFINDVIRGLDKIFDKSKEYNTDDDDSPLLRRAFIFLEDGEFDKAFEYAEKVLDNDPENGEAYLVKLMIDFNVHKREDLGKLNTSFEQNLNYKRILKYGDPDLISEVESYANKNPSSKDFFVRLGSFIKDEVSIFKDNINDSMFKDDINDKMFKENEKKDNYDLEDEQSIIDDYNNIPSEEKIKEKVKNKQSNKNLLIVGIIFCFCYWPIGIIILIARNAKMKKQIAEEQAKYKEIRIKYYKLKEKNKI